MTKYKKFITKNIFNVVFVAMITLTLIPKLRDCFPWIEAVPLSAMLLYRAKEDKRPIFGIVSISLILLYFIQQSMYPLFSGLCLMGVIFNK